MGASPGTADTPLRGGGRGSPREGRGLLSPLRAGGLYFLGIGLFLGIFLLSPSRPPRGSSVTLEIETRHSYGDELTVEREITGPLETALFPLPEITGIRSISRRGSSRIECTFAKPEDLESAYPLVRAAVDRTAAGLSPEIGNPLISRSGGQEPVFIAAIPASDDPRVDSLIESFRSAADCGEIRTGGAVSEHMVLSPLGPGASARYTPSVLPPLIRSYLFTDGHRWARDLGPVSSLPIVPGTGIGDLYAIRRSSLRPKSEGRINGVPVIVISVQPGQAGSPLRICRRLRSVVEKHPGASVIYSARRRAVSSVYSALLPLVSILAGFQILYLLAGSGARMCVRSLLLVVFQCGAALAAASVMGSSVSRELFGGIAAGIGLTQHITFSLHHIRDIPRLAVVPITAVAALLLPEAVLLSVPPRGDCTLGLAATLAAYLPCAVLLLSSHPGGSRPEGKGPGLPLRLLSHRPFRIPAHLLLGFLILLACASGALSYICSSPGAVGWDRTLSGSVYFPEGTPFTEKRVRIISWESRLLHTEEIERVAVSIDEENTRIYLRFGRGITRRRAEGMFQNSSKELDRFFFPDWEAGRGLRAVITVHGPDLAELEALAEAAARAGTGPGGGTRAVFHYGESPKALLLTAVPANLAHSGTDLFSTYVRLFWKYSEGVAGKYALPERAELLDIIVRSEAAGHPLSREAIAAGTVEVSGGELPLERIAELSEMRMPGVILHQGTRRYLALSVYGSRSGGFTRSLREAVGSLPVPPGYGISVDLPERTIPVLPEDILLSSLLAAVCLSVLFRLLRPPAARISGSPRFIFHASREYGRGALLRRLPCGNRLIRSLPGPILGLALGMSLLLPASVSTPVLLLIAPLGGVYTFSVVRKKYGPGINSSASPGMHRLPSAS